MKFLNTLSKHLLLGFSIFFRKTTTSRGLFAEDEGNEIRAQNVAYSAK